MLTTMLLGFSSPQHARGTGESVRATLLDQPGTRGSGPLAVQESDWVDIPSTQESADSVVVEPWNAPADGDAPELLDTSELLEASDAGWVDITNSSHGPVIAPRPSSLADDSFIVPVLGGLSARRWLMPSVYSPDRAIAAQNGYLKGTFHGVGFPDIRTYTRARRSPFDAPEPWDPLVAWRPLKGEESSVEPIARVRCMGLTPQAVARRADRYREMIFDYAETYAVSPHLVKAVITVESCFNNKALSPVGAQGLMQLMPDTAVWLKVKDPHDPAQNLRGGVKYLAALQKEFDTTELALAAYNAGPGNVRRYNGVPPFAETLAYVVKVQSHYRRYKAAYRMLNPPVDVYDQTSKLVINQ